MPKRPVLVLCAVLSAALLGGNWASAADAPKSTTWMNQPDPFNPKTDRTFSNSFGWKTQGFNETRKTEKPAVLLVYNSNAVDRNPALKAARDTFVSWDVDFMLKRANWAPHASLSRGLADLAFDPAADEEFRKGFDWGTKDVNEVRGAGKPAVLLVYDSNSMANNPALANVRNVFQAKDPKKDEWGTNGDLRKGLADLFRPNPLPKDWFTPDKEKKTREGNWVEGWRAGEHLQFVLVDAHGDKWPPEVISRGKNGAEVVVFTCYGKPYGTVRPLGRLPARDLARALVQRVEQVVAQNALAVQMYGKDPGSEWVPSEKPAPDPKVQPVVGEQDWAKGWRGTHSIQFILVDASETRWPPSITGQAGGGAAILVFSCDTGCQRVELGRPADLLEKVKQALRSSSRAVAQYRAGKSPPEWVPPDASVAVTKPDPKNPEGIKTEPDLRKTLLNGLGKDPRPVDNQPRDNQPKDNQPAPPPAGNKPRSDRD